MYLKRKIDKVLEDWRASSSRMPVIVRGPRQVGKTEAVRHFARRHYKNIVEINFARELAYRSIAQRSLSATDVVREISFIDPGKHFVPGESPRALRASSVARAALWAFAVVSASTVTKTRRVPASATDVRSSAAWAAEFSAGTSDLTSVLTRPASKVMAAQATMISAMSPHKTAPAR